MVDIHPDLERGLGRRGCRVRDQVELHAIRLSRFSDGDERHELTSALLYYITNTVGTIFGVDIVARRLAPSLSIAWRGVVVLFTIEIAVVSSMRYFTHSQTPPSVITDNAFANPFLILHVAAGVIALLLGPLQFVQRIRTRLPAVHRATGRIYAAACAVGAPAGFMLALGTTAGPIAGVGFAIPAVLWPIFTYLGVRAAMERRFAEHREWMARSYAVAATAITLRLMLPAAGLLGIPFFPAYRVISWLAWMTNLALVELYLRRNRLPATSDAKLATA